MTKEDSVMDHMQRKSMTHERLVEIANEIFAALKMRHELSAMDEGTREARPHPESDDAELQDFFEDMRRVVHMEQLGIGKAGSADCFAIADVLLRAINRQWAPTGVRT